MSAEYPDVETDKFHIDILTVQFVEQLDRFDVVVSNLFGDILTDLGPVIAGSLCLAPSANLNRRATTPPRSSRRTVSAALISFLPEHKDS